MTTPDHDPFLARAPAAPSTADTAIDDDRAAGAVGPDISDSAVRDGDAGDGDLGDSNAGNDDLGDSNAGNDDLGDTNDADGDDDDFAPRPRQRLGPLSGLLALALALALGFLGGEIAQKHYGSTASAAGAGRAADFTGGEGAAGGFGGFGRTGTGGTAGTGTGGTAGTGTGGTAGTGTGSAITTATPAVIGTVVSVKGSTVLVKNLGGTKVVVHLTAATTVTVSVKNGTLKAGQTVSVAGKTANKVVTATSVLVR